MKKNIINNLLALLFLCSLNAHQEEFILEEFIQEEFIQEEPIIETALFINELYASSELSSDEIPSYKHLRSALSKTETDQKASFFHIFSEVQAGSKLVLEDDSTWTIGYWYRDAIRTWEKGNRLKISYKPSYYPNANDIEITNIDKQQTVWATFGALPSDDKKQKVSHVSKTYQKTYGWKVCLKSGAIFEHEALTFSKSKWEADDEIFIFHTSSGLYDLWNVSKMHYVSGWSLGRNTAPTETDTIKVEDVLNLEEKLNCRVLGQNEASSILTNSLISYCAGLKNPKKPIGVFLFLGPTGVGKTEMAKVLADEVFHSPNAITRFDMSHFSAEYSAVRLYGAPPGYLDHEQGGQLTEALRKMPSSLILLDEFEKAHAAVRKVFLPIFDEGYVADADNIKVPCNDAIFIMTSNLCADKIRKLFYQNYTSDAILEIIEPELIDKLSPEIYNRVQPVLFQPLRFELMKDLTDLALDELIKTLKETKQITLFIDQSVKDFLIENGFNQALGARPLKRLIDQKVVSALSFAIVKENIPNGSQLKISYSEASDSWHVDYEL